MALRPDQILKAMKYQYIIQPFAYLALVFGRVSFAVSLIVIIGINKQRRWLLYALIVSQFVVNITWIGIQLGQCNPPQKYWNRSLPGTCMDPKVQGNAGYVSQCEYQDPSWLKKCILSHRQAFNIFTDFVLAVLPSVVISNLNMRLRTKVGLIFLMGLGILYTSFFSLCSIETNLTGLATW